MTNEEAKMFLDNLKICIDEHPVVADWLVEIANRKTEPTISKMEQVDDDAYFLELMGAVERGEISDAGANQAWYEYINHKDEPQTDGYISGEDFMKIFDEPQTDEPPMDEYYKDHDEFYDCDRYVITNDEGERAYNCIGCEQTDCAWR